MCSPIATIARTPGIVLSANRAEQQASLRRLRFVTVEQLGKQGVELSSFRGVEAGEEFVLDRIGVLLEVLEVLPTGGGEGDDVATPVGGVRLTAHLVVAFEAVEDAVDVVAIKAEAAADFGLAERPVLLQRCQDGEVGAGAQRHASGEQPGAER